MTEEITSQLEQYNDVYEELNDWVSNNIKDKQQQEYLETILSRLDTNNDIIWAVKKEIENMKEYQDSSCGKTVGCFQQLCSCSASDSDYPMDIQHNKYCRFYRR